MLADLDAELAERVRGIAYNRVAVVALGYRASEIALTLDGFGYLSPQRERRDVLGVQWCSSIFPGRCVTRRPVSVAGDVRRLASRRDGGLGRRVFAAPRCATNWRRRRDCVRSLCFSRSCAGGRRFRSITSGIWNELRGSRNGRLIQGFSAGGQCVSRGGDERLRRTGGFVGGTDRLPQCAARKLSAVSFQLQLLSGMKSSRRAKNMEG